MNQFNMGRAWSLGFDFIRRAPAGHAILLIGMAVVVPTIIQYALIGSTASWMNPAMFSQGGGAAGALAAAGGAVAIAGIIGYVLQTGGYFGSWRLGLNRGAEVGGAAGYGIVAGILLIVLFIVIGIVAYLLTRVLGAWAIVPLLIIALPLIGALYSLIVAMMCVLLLLMAVITAVFGAAAGSSFGTANALGAGVLGAFIMIAVALLLLWVTARFCCVATVLAYRGDYNLVAALGESWRLTSRGQGMIMLYLALIGLVLGVLFVIMSGVVAVGTLSSLGSTGGVPQMGIGMVIFSIIFGIAFAYVSVLVPAGIYRALQPDVDASAAVFD